MAKFVCNVISYTLGRTVDITVVIPTPTIPDSMGMTKDFLYEANVTFRDRPIELGCEVTWDETEEHGHEWRFWNLEIERFLDWLPRTDPYAMAGRKRQI